MKTITKQMSLGKQVALCVLCAALLAPPFTFAQNITGRTALLIGISQYQSPDTPALSGVPHDLVSAQKIALAMGVPAGNIRVLKDQAATKSNILNALRNLGDQTSDGARTFIYFSGHGTRWKAPDQDGCVEGLLTYDGQTLINREIAEVTGKLTQKADKVIAMYDACHSQGVAPDKAQTRSLSALGLMPKYFMKTSNSGADTCSQPSNLRTRSLLGEATRLGALQENFVQITSSRHDEVSFDEPGKGGLATQGVRDCLLGGATDVDESGAVSLAEIQACAQATIDKKLKNSSLTQPHHITVSGTRNLVPVAVPRPNKEPAPPAAPSPIAQQSALTPTPSIVSAPTPVVAAEAPAAVIDPGPISQPEAPATLVALEVVAEPTAPASASLATLKDIEAQRNPRRKVEVLIPKQMRIGKDALNLTITSSHEGYVYLVLLGSDAKSFYVLFPNGLDGNNRIQAKKPLSVPKPDWKIMAAGPAGTDHLLVMVSDSPRRLNELTLASPTSAEPFTYALTTLQGRAALVNYLTGNGINGASESFGAKLVSIKEVP